MDFEPLILWYTTHGRDLPWRQEKSVYKVWLSEIILQQTRIEQGLPYFQKFVSVFPTLKHLATASQDEVLALWQGLGYYNRAINLYKAAQIIYHQYKGKMPETYGQWLTLPGIGVYTASAIASICFNEKQAAVDGNVIRLVSRLWCLETDNSSNQKKIKKLLDKWIINYHSGTFNQAMMELGSRVCTPFQPKCGICPLEKQCLALQQNKILQFPIKSKAIKKKNRYFYYTIVEHEKMMLIKKRDQSDIWRGLYDLPCIQCTKKIKPSLCSQRMEGLKLPLKLCPNTKPEFYTITKLSHQNIYVYFIKSKWVSDSNILSSPYLWVKESKYKTMAKPQFMKNYFITNR